MFQGNNFLLARLECLPMCNLLPLAWKQPLDKNVKIWDIWNGYTLLLVFNIIIKCLHPLRGVQMFPVWISKPFIWHTEEKAMFLSVYYCCVCFDNPGLVDFVFWLVIFVLNTRLASAVFLGKFKWIVNNPVNQKGFV